MKTVQYQLELLTCPSCIKKIEGKIGKMEGVEAVKVLFHSSKVKMTYDQGQITSNELKTTIEKLGYPVVS